MKGHGERNDGGRVNGKNESLTRRPKRRVGATLIALVIRAHAERVRGIDHRGGGCDFALATVNQNIVRRSNALLEEIQWGVTG